MKVLVVGGGGREHAIVRKLKESPLCTELWAAPGNGGIALDAPCAPIAATDLEGQVEFACKEGFDYVVVAPDDPLAMGLVDRLAQAGIPAFGPNAAAARIEASKAFSKDLMHKYGIPTARYQVFTESAPALEYIRSQGRYPVVIKADGLALGKGVLICNSEEEARQALHQMLEDKVFGASGSQVVVEEFLTGPEVSVLAFADGKTLKPMVSSMDHKRALDGDQGLNTGGMGTIAPNPYYTQEIADQCMETIFMPTLRAMEVEGCPFRGCLYFGLMLTPSGPKVIEYNCRFGDPETQGVPPPLQGDRLETMLACTNGTLDQVPVHFRPQHAACVILASGGYPQSYGKGKVITGLQQGQLPGTGASVYHAGTAQQEGQLVTSGGRVLGVTATGNTLEQAVKAAYQASEAIAFEGMHKRTDIGRRALAACKGE